MGRVSHSVPYLGTLFGLVVGPLQAVVLVGAGVALIVWSHGRGPELPPDPGAQRRGRGRRARVGRVRAAAAAVALVGTGAVALVTV
ncbi:MAG: hypothetical protein KatS3mg010_0503 [Acidimicrobiia bacterium]|nr:MAG: hypothetical protein KatS3mg010_0503 [Acidimicrobiia bacterium]